ncbi:MAG: WecB/TagA/CpsF family glycosyltransferase [Pseudorhodobacter sp.]|nr:WecB/TagA/CpsF family glycosyltransferase [Pseudorhodobacter sp.]
MKHVTEAELKTAAIPFAAQQTPLKTQQVLGLNIVDTTAEIAITALLEPGHRRAFFLNAHCHNVMTTDRAYAAAMLRADAILPDGLGVELAAKMAGRDLTANLNGTDFVPALLQVAAARGLSVYLFGATPGTADAAANTLILRCPGLRIAGTRDGFAGAQDAEAVIADINQSGADIVLVALGVPAQELWLDTHAHRLNARLSLGVGALFDFLAGNVSRAPLWVRKSKMEWVWRLAMEPRRMAKRYLVGNVSFMARATRIALNQLHVNDVIKRGMDVTIASAALILLSPLFLATMLAIRLDSKGPVFFQQSRVGLKGIPFPVFKFRSMHVDAEARRAELLKTSDREGICFKSRNDPRITRVGRFIRRFSIDELPQIVNVLRGEMSIVGPRPALPQEVAAYPTRAFGRLAVKPGITGIWQVSGRADIGFEKMIDMDLSYAKSHSPLLDMILIALTFRAVLSGRGAY